ncbi:MAG: hypothetical protein WAM07_08980 [Halobacillus sp.]|uniref:hypothetical protein n=1 Tax=Halobacillus sp. TaxID=56800 RepID=UPI003BAF8982
MFYSQPIVWQTRVIKDNQQVYTEEQSTLDLYESEVITPTETYRLKDIFDVSYKPFSDSYGLLYLHTIKGVKTYMVKESPEAWMEAYHHWK